MVDPIQNTPKREELSPKENEHKDPTIENTGSVASAALSNSAREPTIGITDIVKKLDQGEDISKKEAQTLLQNADPGSWVEAKEGNTRYIMKKLPEGVDSKEGNVQEFKIADDDEKKELFNKNIIKGDLRVGKKGEIIKDKTHKRILLAAKEFLNGIFSMTPTKGGFEKLKENTNKKKNQGYLLEVENENVSSSRFADIPLIRNGAIKNPLKEGKYLHANTVELNRQVKHIAAQIPEAKEDIGAFWEMAAEKSNLIVDVSRTDDEVEYYPEVKGTEKEYGETKVKLDDVKDIPGKMKLYTYSVTTKGGENKTVKRLHFSEWPDHGVATVQQLTSIVDKMRELEGELPVIVHCRAGVGRTGVVITASLLDKDSLSRAELNEVILQGREQRGENFVQTEEQYKLLEEFSKKQDQLEAFPNAKLVKVGGERFIEAKIKTTEVLGGAKEPTDEEDAANFLMAIDDKSVIVDLTHPEAYKGHDRFLNPYGVRLLGSVEGHNYGKVNVKSKKMPAGIYVDVISHTVTYKKEGSTKDEEKTIYQVVPNETGFVHLSDSKVYDEVFEYLNNYNEENKPPVVYSGDQGEDRTRTFMAAAALKNSNLKDFTVAKAIEELPSKTPNYQSVIKPLVYDRNLLEIYEKKKLEKKQK